MLYFLVVLISLLLGIGASIYLFKKPIEVRYKYHKEDWIIPISFALFSYLCAFILEYIIVLIAINVIDDSNKIGYLIIRLLDNGILVPFICFFLSKMFKIIVNKLELNYSKTYSSSVTKVCFSVIIIAMGIKLISFIIVENESIDIDYSINRVMIWLATVIGSWIGFEDDQNDNKKAFRENFKKDALKEKIIFWWPIIFILCITSIIVLFSDLIFKNKIIVNVIFIGLLTIMIAFLTGILVLKFRFNPTEKSSIKKYNKLVEEYENSNGKSRKEYFCHMPYWLKNGKIYTGTVKVIYKEHEDDKKIRKLFFRRRKTILDYESTLNYLINRNNEQKLYLEQEFTNCKEIIKQEIENISEE